MQALSDQAFTLAMQSQSQYNPALHTCTILFIDEHPFNYLAFM